MLQEGAASTAPTPAALLPGKLWVQTTEGEVKEVEGEVCSQKKAWATGFLEKNGLG